MFQKHSTKNSYQTLIITFPRFFLRFVLARRIEQQHGADEPVDWEERRGPQSGTDSRTGGV